MVLDKQETLILKQFKIFIKYNFNIEYFTKRLYQYFTLKCGFIAHFDLYGFYIEYFTEIQNIEKFYKKLSEYRYNNSIVFREIINKLKDFLDN